MSGVSGVSGTYLGLAANLAPQGQKGYRSILGHWGLLSGIGM